MLRIILIILILPLFNINSRSRVNPQPDPLVKINILSKQVRLIKEGMFEKLIFILPENSITEDRISHKIFRSKRLHFFIQNGKWHVSIGRFTFERPVRLFIHIPEGEGSFVAKISGKKRRYPLPLTVYSSGDNLRIFVKEKLNRYAVDSAIAEYGIRPLRDREAVMALAHIIIARYHIIKKRRLHKEFDFCDLTHCQVYRGRTNANISFNDRWLIDWKRLKNNLFFHSRCSGHTLDIRVFKSIGNKFPHSTVYSGVRDWLYREGIKLCSDPNSGWNRRISSDELCKILFNEGGSELSVSYNKKLMSIIIQKGENSFLFAPETFRLKLNRPKGWNFLKSNHYSVSKKLIDKNQFFYFTGRGLGHGVGFCQHGAISLSRKGYSRYEILKHYFPEISFRLSCRSRAISPYLSYCIFDIHTGEIIDVSPKTSFINRRIPPGSIFKLIVSLYLAKERIDLFNGYSFTCTGKNEKHKNLPDRCWNTKGHGKIMLKEALANSCNLYFASLYEKISYENFRRFFSDFCRDMKIDTSLPEVSSAHEWSRMLAGLDFRISFKIKDLIKIIRALNPEKGLEEDIETSIYRIPFHIKMKIYHSMKSAFIKGTASGKIKEYGSPYNYEPLVKWKVDSISDDKSVDDFWGKTSTVIDGTNRPVGYGLFIGGCGDKGIVTVLRRGNGHLAAKWARVIYYITVNGMP